MTDGSGDIPRRLPPARGLGWLAASWALLKKEPLRLFLISLFLQLLLSFSQAQALGLLVVLCLPALSAGMLQAFGAVDRGQRPGLAVLFAPFMVRGQAGRLLLLGGLVILIGLVVVSLLLSGTVLQLDAGTVSRIESGDLEAIGKLDPKLIEHMIVAVAAGAAITGSITYFAVPLIWFKRRSTGRAVVLGLKALGRNWKPLLVLGLSVTVVALPLVILLSASYLSALGGGSGSSWLAALMLLIGPLFQLLLFGTQYTAFKDIFGLQAEPGRPPEGPDDQLLA